MDEIHRGTPISTKTSSVSPASWYQSSSKHLISLVVFPYLWLVVPSWRRLFAEFLALSQRSAWSDRSFLTDSKSFLRWWNLTIHIQCSPKSPKKMVLDISGCRIIVLAQVLGSKTTKLPWTPETRIARHLRPPDPSALAWCWCNRDRRPQFPPQKLRLSAPDFGRGLWFFEGLVFHGPKKEGFGSIREPGKLQCWTRKSGCIRLDIDISQLPTPLETLLISAVRFHPSPGEIHSQSTGYYLSDIRPTLSDESYEVPETIGFLRSLFLTDLDHIIYWQY